MVCFLENDNENSKMTKTYSDLHSPATKVGERG